MPARCYPGFEPGQTLTAEDLEVLRDFLDRQDRVTRQMIGFGVVCGLDGSVEGTQVVVSPGLAIDQDGEGALIDGETRLDTTAPDEDRFDFIDTDEGGFTPVLVIEDVEQPAPECDEEGCEGHSTLWCREVRIALVEGRLVVDPNDFATDPLLDANPVTVSATGAVHGAFVGLRDAITQRWTQAGISLAADARAILSDLSIASSDLTGIKAYKAAFLNQVLFATLDLLRCMSLHRAMCLRTEGDRAVALGWVEKAGATLTWDCRYRHHFQPQTGMVSALLGGRCDDPCELYRDRLEAMILNFRVPEVPKPEEPPSPKPPSKGDYHLCWKHVHHKKPGVWEWLYGECERWKVPPIVVKPNWKDLYEIPLELDILNKQDWWTDPPPDPWRLYGDPPLDLTDAGTLTLVPSLGKDVEAAGRVITELLDDAGMSPDVRIVDQGGLGGMKGFSYEATVSLGDTVVLVADDVGKVVATGRIANAQTIRGAEAGIADAVGKADGALATAGEAVGLASGFDNRIAQTESTLGVLDKFRTDTVAWQAGLQPKIDGIDQMVDLAVKQALPGIQTQLQGFVNQAVRGIEGRVDDLYKFSVVEGGKSRQVTTNRQLVDVLNTMRVSIAAGATGEAAEAVRTELAKADEALAVLAVTVGTGEPVVEAAPAELAKVIESLVSAAGKAGVPRAEMRRLERDAGNLFERLR